MADLWTKRRRVADNIKTTLAAIVGDGVAYNYTPVKVERVDSFMPEHFADHVEHFYLVRPGPSPEVLKPSMVVEEEATFYVLGARKVEAATINEPYSPGNTLLWDVQEKIAHDVYKALRLDITRGHLATYTDIRDTQLELYQPGWAVVVFEVLCEYNYLFADPQG